jgi:hypothetical protein
MPLLPPVISATLPVKLNGANGISVAPRSRGDTTRR